MGPKPKESSKTTQKKTEKIVQDKTFGLKNKKGAKQQKYIQQVEKNVTARSNKDNPKNDEKERRKIEKEAREEMLKLINKPVIDFKALAKGVDPKSVRQRFTNHND